MQSAVSRWRSQDTRSTASGDYRVRIHLASASIALTLTSACVACSACGTTREPDSGLDAALDAPDGDVGDGTIGDSGDAVPPG